MGNGGVANLQLGINTDFPPSEGVIGDPDLLDVANNVPLLIGQSFSVSSVNDNVGNVKPHGEMLDAQRIMCNDKFMSYVRCC